MLHQLLTGSLPYAATKNVELARDIAGGRIQNLVADEPLRSIIQRALSLEPSDRFESAGALAAALRRVQPSRWGISRRGFIGATIAAATVASGVWAYRYQAASNEPTRWLAAALAATPERQVDMVTARLKQLNLGFNAAIESKIIDGQVQEWSMPTDLITDISPLRALSHLKKLSLTGPIEPSLDIPKCHGNLSDLAPLRGLQLESLVAPFNPKLHDLSPLEGMPLKLLQIAYSGVTDLSPLRGMPLEELRAGGAPLSDLSPLESTPLKVVTLDRTQVRRLPNLQSTPLETLFLQFTPLESLEGIEGTPLRHLECHQTPLTDLTPIKSLKNLWGMTIYKTKITDLSPLIDSGGLQILYCDYVPERDRDIIAKIPRLEIVNDRPLAELLK
jgi:Leucine-rich repeat (LRR) protein